MPKRLPLRLILLLAAMTVASFSVSLYLEAEQLAFLERHPIMVNLISGVVGFSAGLVALSVGLNWLIDFNNRDARVQALREILSGARRLVVFHARRAGVDYSQQWVLIRANLTRLDAGLSPELEGALERLRVAPKDPQVLERDVQKFMNQIKQTPELESVTRRLQHTEFTLGKPVYRGKWWQVSFPLSN